MAKLWRVVEHAIPNRVLMQVRYQKCQSYTGSHLQSKTRFPLGLTRQSIRINIGKAMEKTMEKPWFFPNDLSKVGFVHIHHG